MVGAFSLLGKRDSCNICELAAEIRAEKRNKVVAVAIDCLRAGGGCNKSIAKLRDDVERNLSFASRSISRSSPLDGRRLEESTRAIWVIRLLLRAQRARLRRKPAIKKVNHKRNGLVSLFFVNLRVSSRELSISRAFELR